VWEGLAYFTSMRIADRPQQIKRLGPVILGFLLLVGACRSNNRNEKGKNPDTVTHNFGDSVPISNGLKGRVYLLPDTTRHLPDFDTLDPLPDPLYVTEINVPYQSWSVGFPGLRSRFEWFGIRYTGSFQPHQAGKYYFKLTSDDGSKLYIDDKLFINNDGIHADGPVSDSIYLSDSIHTIKLDYFQGPRYSLALQLYWNLGDSAYRIFPGKAFVLYPPKPVSWWWLWMLIGLAVLSSLILLIKKLKKNTV
jgi:hypothetical protein